MLNEMEQSPLSDRKQEKPNPQEELEKKREARKLRARAREINPEESTQLQIVEELSLGKILQTSPTTSRLQPKVEHSAATDGQQQQQQQRSAPASPVKSSAAAPSPSSSVVGVKEEKRLSASPPRKGTSPVISPSPLQLPGGGGGALVPPPSNTSQPHAVSPPTTTANKPPPSPKISMSNTFIDVDAEGTYVPALYRQPKKRITQIPLLLLGRRKCLSQQSRARSDS